MVDTPINHKSELIFELTIFLLNSNILQKQCSELVVDHLGCHDLVTHSPVALFCAPLFFSAFHMFSPFSKFYSLLVDA